MGNGNGTFTTDEKGTLTISNLEKGTYIVQETKAPENYILENQSQTIEIDYGKTYTLDFYNKPKSGLVIKKTDDKTTLPLAGAVFKVTHKNGEVVGEYTTDKDGIIQLENLSPNWYTIVETKAPEGYLLDSTPKDIQVTNSQLISVEFTNMPKSGLNIKKTDDKTALPLAGAVFKVTQKNGEVVGEYTTDKDGVIQLDNLSPNWYTIVETKAPEGYLLDSTPKDVQVTNSQLITVEFTNKPKSGLIIKKTDNKTALPLTGAVFKITQKNGEIVGEYSTDKDGVIQLDNLSPNWYTIVETKAPEGYLLDSTPKDIQVTNSQLITVEFTNKMLTSLQIKKVDEITGAPLLGADFWVERQNGEHIGNFTMDKDGFINIPTLTPDFYVIREIKAPANYILDNTPKTVEVKTQIPTVVTFTNKPLAGLQIKKINSVTRQPIADVEFSISKMNGEKIGNFKTDKDGLIFISNLQDGYYIVTEVQGVEGYIADNTPKTIEIKWGKPTFLEVENKPNPALVIKKVDTKGNVLEGVKFEVRKENGELTGEFKTDKNGRIYIDDLEEGKYIITEKKALKGYELDKEPKEVNIKYGKQTVVEFVNKQLAGLRLLKIDSVTERPIYNVEFRVYDFETNKEVEGPYYTDNEGIIDFSGILSAGRYKIVETRPAEGYLRDDTPRTIEFKAGKITEVTWKNVPNMGQVQILKLSAADNEINGLPKGTPLAGAVFEVYQHRTGNLIDQFTTGNDGKGASKPLPTGRYTIKEVTAPKYYKINDKPLDIEIEYPNQILKFEFTNEAANIGVAIKKVGTKETMAGQQVRYDFKQIQNTSTVPLSDFFWRDVIPADAIKVNTIVTGTYNQSVKYKIMFKTNKNNYRVMADNLSSIQNNVIDASPASLGIYSDEYITEIMVVFGNVKAGFCQVETPYILATTNKGLPNGYQFANSAPLITA